MSQNIQSSLGHAWLQVLSWRQNGQKPSDHILSPGCPDDATVAGSFPRRLARGFQRLLRLFHGKGAGNPPLPFRAGGCQTHFSKGWMLPSQEHCSLSKERQQGGSR